MMPARFKNAKWLLLGIALLVLPLALSCGSSSDTADTETEEVDPVVEAMGAATKVADQQDRGITRAWSMAQVALAWAAVDPDAAEEAVADSISAAEEAAGGGDEQRQAAADLREQAATWTPTEWRSAIALAERIERNASRAWVLRAIAGELADEDPELAGSLLGTAQEIARANPLPQYRAADESAIAVELARIDAAGALEAAAAIEDAAAKARALREISEQLQSTDPELAAAALSDALTAARAISYPVDRSWALRQSAGLAGVDTAGARGLLAEAEAAADEIMEVEPQAFARADIAVAWAALDTDEAMAALDRISADYPDARVAALVGIAEARIEASDAGGGRSALEQVLIESEEILDTYERAQVVNVAVEDMAALDLERAVSLAEEIEDTYLRADALRFLAVATAEESPDEALSLAEVIEPPFIRVQALVAIGESAAARDEEAAVSIFEQALSEAGDLKDTYPLMLLASAWAPLDLVKALEIASRVDDTRDQAQALTDVAVAMVSTDPERARVTFQTAHEAAQGIKDDADPFAAVTALRDLADVWLPVDEAEATQLYATAFEAAQAVPVEEPAG